MTTIPGIGTVSPHENCEDWLHSEPIYVGVLGHECRFILDEYADDPNKEEFHVAIANFLALDLSVLKVVEADVFRYYEAVSPDFDAPEIETASGVWKHVRLGTQPTVRRRPYGDEGIYISVGGGCDWEPEHGIEFVFRNGQHVNKLGPHDGHLTNSDAYDDPKLENTVYA